jgi:hypothetical protein
VESILYVLLNLLLKSVYFTMSSTVTLSTALLSVSEPPREVLFLVNPILTTYYGTTTFISISSSSSKPHKYCSIKCVRAIIFPFGNQLPLGHPPEYVRVNSRWAGCSRT